jgi:cyclophilin family peptidyl-prolyl cis-trans isomerase
MSNTIGTVSFANHGVPNSRATEIFVNFQDNSHLDSEGFVPFATVVGAKGLATAVAIHNPTPNNTGGVDQQSYADKGTIANNLVAVPDACSTAAAAAAAAAAVVAVAACPSPSRPHADAAVA